MIKGQKQQKRGLKVPFNWDIDLFGEMAKINAASRTLFPIMEVYAADKFSVMGSGRTSNTVHERTLPLEAYIEEAHRHNIKFEYIWNAITMGGNEWDTTFQERLYGESKKLVDAGVDSFTVTNTLLCLKFKKWFPGITVTSSVNNHLDSVERVKQLIEYTDIDRIMLDNRHSRNVGLIKKVHRKYPQHPIIVLVNEACLPDCSLQAYHQEHTAHSSRLGSGYHAPDLCRILCTTAKMKNPVYSLKAPWVRPEDIHYLFDAGASLMKLAGRTESSDWILRMCRAYAYGSYEGDIWEFIEKPGSIRPEWETAAGRKLEPCRFRVNNRDLDGFIEPFIEGSVPCVKTQNGCGTCKWCDRWMHAVTCPTNLLERMKDLEKIYDHAVGHGKL
ncbi:hypothetical protein [Geobacter sp. AOG1]|uniref:hypothetical protein n=1 Tax=Geobacter sp. AOG1 TaxID=1566346 RepID=UPI001CC7B88C|nr:hypothetical protein [Geobacter sp. AOG1]GFE57334.1 hypothetical protein AOG1_12140 [Geobacter sp. AOG1]